MFGGTLLSALSPGNEIGLFICGLVLLALGLGSLYNGLSKARNAHRARAGAEKFSSKSYAFYFAVGGLFGVCFGGSMVISAFVPMSMFAIWSLAGLMMVVTTLMAVLAWRYVIADRKATEARIFDMRMWHFFNG